MTLNLVVLAAGLSSRFGSDKQLASVGPHDEALMDYAVFDAVLAGFDGVTFVIRRELEQRFQNHAERRFGKRLSVSFAYQDLADLPTGFSVPTIRKKPWGTAHAILAARDIVRDPFVVINADDFYGASAYALLHEHLTSCHATGTGDFAMIGYPLGDTFSPFGGVSRGICECDARGFLEKLLEIKQIEEKDGKIAGFTVSGEPFSLRGDEIVSMNIWGLTPAVFPILEQQLSEFLLMHGEDPDAEFLISSALNEQIATGRTRLKVIPTRDRWLGMTFERDRENVMRQLATLVQRGDYPINLSSWFLEHR